MRQVNENLLLKIMVGFTINSLFHHHCCICARGDNIITCSNRTFGFITVQNFALCLNTRPVEDFSVIWLLRQKARQTMQQHEVGVHEFCKKNIFLSDLFCFLLGCLQLFQQGLFSLPFFHQLHATVGHQQHRDGGHGES